MPKVSKDFKKEFGKSCVSYFFILNAAVFLTPFVNDKPVDTIGRWIVVAFSVILLLFGMYLLRDGKQLPGKWKRVKVKKDTTIHIEEG